MISYITTSIYLKCFFFYVIGWEAESQSWTDKQIYHPLVHSLDDHDGWGWKGLKPGTGNSIQFCYVGGRNPLTRIIITASQSGRQQEAEITSRRWGLNSDTPEQDVGVLSGFLTTRLGACPLHLFSMIFLSSKISSLREVYSLAVSGDWLGFPWHL